MRVIILITVLISVILFENAFTLAQTPRQKITSSNKNSPVKKRKLRALRQLFEQQRMVLLDNNVSNANPCLAISPINFGQTLNGSLASSDCNLGDNSYIDFYSFNARAGQIVAIELNSTQFDSFLLLIKNNVLIGLDDNSGGGNNSRLRLTLPANGTYVIGTNSFAPLGTGNYSLTLTAEVSILRTKSDFDSDGKAEIGYFRPEQSGLGTWNLMRSSQGLLQSQFGQATDKIAPADYDNDGKTDIAVYRPAVGTWYLQRSTAGYTFIQFGTSEDLPVPADFDGEGQADLAVFRPSNGTWYIERSSQGFYSQQFGLNGDIPQAGDFDGDGRADICVFRPSNGYWYRMNSSNNQFVATQFGLNGDIPQSADFDNDGKTDIAVFRPSNGTWFLQQSTAGFASIQFGLNGDRPAAADYDGDGKADVAVFRPSIGQWYVNRTTQGFYTVQFGANGDIPIAAAF